MVIDSSKMSNAGDIFTSAKANCCNDRPIKNIKMNWWRLFAPEKKPHKVETKTKQTRFICGSITETRQTIMNTEKKHVPNYNWSNEGKNKEKKNSYIWNTRTNYKLSLGLNTASDMIWPTKLGQTSNEFEMKNRADKNKNHKNLNRRYYSNTGWDSCFLCLRLYVLFIVFVLQVLCLYIILPCRLDNKNVRLHQEVANLPCEHEEKIGAISRIQWLLE